MQSVWSRYLPTGWLPLIAILVTLLRISASQTAPPPMAVDADPSYEVATIKRAGPDERRVVQVQGVRLFTAGTSLVDLMMFAYGVHQAQVTGGPEWMKTEKFDLLIQPNMPGRPSTAQMRSIARKLLADRFKLVMHHAQKELPVYGIVAAKGGPKLTPTTAESVATNTATAGYREGEFMAKNATMSEFASLMQRYIGLDRPIVDHTGIGGKYDFKLDWAPDSSPLSGTAPGRAASDANAGPDFFTAIQEQLGLKLQPLKEPTDVLVIDSVERPSEN
jgi:uncharacterized protein (TIGR03435 family)